VALHYDEALVEQGLQRHPLAGRGAAVPALLDGALCHLGEKRRRLDRESSVLWSEAVQGSLLVGAEVFRRGPEGVALPAVVVNTYAGVRLPLAEQLQSSAHASKVPAERTSEVCRGCRRSRYRQRRFEGLIIGGGCGGLRTVSGEEFSGCHTEQMGEVGDDSQG